MENVNVAYEKIFEDNVKNQKQVYQRFKQNYDKREEMKTENSSHHGIPGYAVCTSCGTLV
jgi:hypothetical protein